MLIAALTLALVQTSAPPRVPAQDPEVLPPIGLYPGGIEAPTQPTGESAAGVRRSRRLTPTAAATSGGSIRVRVGDIVAVRGQEDNVIQGIGLVTGLNGSGDSGAVARQALINFLLTQNITVSPGDVTSKNVALVHVEATMPAGIKPGRRLDLRCSSWGDAKNLIGGQLVHTVLTDSTGNIVYGTGSGPISVGGFSAEGDSATVQRNHPTVGIIPGGCKVERSVPSDIVSEHGQIYLDARSLKGSYANIVRIVDAINEIYMGAASAEDGMTVRVAVPEDLPASAYVAYLDSILRREIIPDDFARIVINERTGVIVMGEGVRITRGAVTKGNITVTIAETPEVSQPGPLSGGDTQGVPRSNVLVEEEDRAITIVNGASDLAEVVEVLNVLGVTPLDMIQILQSMNQSGMLHAEILSL